MIDKEGNLKMTIDQIEQEYCNGNFNNNPLLKLMIIYFAFGSLAREQIKNKGWITDEDLYYRDFTIALHHFYLKRDYESRIGKIESLHPSYLSQSTIKFFIDNKLGFRMSNSMNLVQFLSRIDYIGLPKGTSIDKITKFEGSIIFPAFRWNKNTFEKYLMEKMKNNLVSREDYDKFIKLIE